MNVGIITINVNGLRNKKAELVCFINNLKQIYTDVIIMLNDTRLHGGLDFLLPGFSLIRGDKNTRDSTPGGSAIAVPNTWDVQQVPAITESGNGYESVGILAAPPKAPPIKLLGIYNRSYTDESG